MVRVAATPEVLKDVSAYETCTRLESGDARDTFVVVHRNGKPHFCWTKNAVPFTPKLQEQLIREGKLKREEARFGWSILRASPWSFIRGRSTEICVLRVAWGRTDSKRRVAF